MVKKIFILFLLVFLSQCNDISEFYHKNENINNQWGKNNFIEFPFDISDEENRYNINFVIENNDEYMYSNLYLFVKLKKGNEIIIQDTINYPMADVRGNWLGQGNKVKKIELSYKRDFKFPMKGRYQVSVSQAMRHDVLKGIESIGLIIEKEENEK